VVVRDLRPDIVERGMATVRSLFAEGVKRGKHTTADAEAGLARITCTTEWGGFDSCGIAIEAIVENVEAKRRLFGDLARIVGPGALLASNTSAIPIEEIAGHVPHPERTLGLHFFNPVSRMPLLELVVGKHTGGAEVERAIAFAKSLGKSPVVCRSSPGFLVTRVLFFYLNEAVRLWEDGAPTEAIDSAMKGFGWPMGPMRLIDEIGVDVTDFIIGEMARYYPERFRPTIACGEMAKAGFLGRKNGAGSGFYTYASGAATPAIRAGSGPDGKRALPVFPETRAKTPAPPPQSVAAHLMSVMIAEAKLCLLEGVVKSAADIDFAMNAGAGFPVARGGLMTYADTLRS
jgi:3-hydroxyacyl-CoA dehydrogenase/enoyl-CoA hydratase/3-hydroxybutyryl-CoA epimerase